MNRIFAGGREGEREAFIASRCVEKYAAVCINQRALLLSDSQ